MELLLLFIHEADFAEFLHPLHGCGIVARMFAARPKSGRVVVVGFVEFERKVVTNEEKAVEAAAVADGPGHRAQRHDAQAYRCTSKSPTSIRPTNRPHQKKRQQNNHSRVGEKNESPDEALIDPDAAGRT